MANRRDWRCLISRRSLSWLRIRNIRRTSAVIVG